MSNGNKRRNDPYTKHFRDNPDYKSAFSAAVTELVNGVRASLFPDRTERSRAIEALIDEYVTSTGERPDVAELERLADAVLHEELTDQNPHKISHTEYPFMSETQLSLRRDREVSLWVAKELDQDGVDRKPKKRRMRSKYEHAFMDRTVKSRNKERLRKHRVAMTPSPIITYNLYDN